MAEPNAVTLTELRVLDGPNVYFARPAIKVTLGITPWLALPEERALQLSERSAETYLGSPGPPGSDRRRRFIARLAVHLTRSLAEITKTRLAVRGRAGAQADQIVVAFPWRRKQTAEAFAKEIPGLLTVALDARHSVARAIADAGHRVDRVEPRSLSSAPPITITGPGTVPFDNGSRHRIDSHWLRVK